MQLDAIVKKKNVWKVCSFLIVHIFKEIIYLYLNWKYCDTFSTNEKLENDKTKSWRSLRCWNAPQIKRD